MSKPYTLFDSRDDDSIDKKKIETDKEKLINALEVDEKMSSIQAPNNIVEYMQLAEEQELAEVQSPKPKEVQTPEPKTISPTMDNKTANMRTVIKRFDDIENKINKVIELLSKDTGEQK